MIIIITKHLLKHKKCLILMMIVFKMTFLIILKMISKIASRAQNSIKTNSLKNRILLVRILTPKVNKVF